MWFSSFVLAVGALITLLVFGSAAYLESTGSVNMARAISGPVPLPKAKPVARVKEPEENEMVTQPPLPEQMPRRANVRRGY
jgi:hypothetical protein